MRSSAHVRRSEHLKRVDTPVRNGAMLHRGRLDTGRSFVANNPCPADSFRRPPGLLCFDEHSSDQPQLTRLRCCGDGVVSSGRVLQAHGSDVLHRLAARLSAQAARFSAQAYGCCTEQAGRVRSSTYGISWTDQPRVYHNAQVTVRIYARLCGCSSGLLPAQSYPQPTHATKPGNPVRGDVLDRLRLAYTTTRRRFGGVLVAHTRDRRNDSPCAKPTTCTTLFADQNRRLEVMPPNAVHRQ